MIQDLERGIEQTFKVLKQKKQFLQFKTLLHAFVFLLYQQRFSQAAVQVIATFKYSF